VSLALASKLAKTTRGRYPFLARELNAKFSTSTSTITNVPKPNTLSLSFVFRAQRTNNKPEILGLPTARGRNSLKIIVFYAARGIAS
jgi:hypothetical protein